MARKVTLTKSEKLRLTHKIVLRSGLQDDTLEGALSDVIRALTELSSEYPDYDELRMENNYYYESSSMELVGFKQESDEKYTIRMDLLLKRKRKTLEKQEREEKKLMKELLKKYGKD